MKTPEQLKGSIRNISKKMNLSPQEVLQMFVFERFLERLALSRYKDNFVLKGGLLISSMIGIVQRTTSDLDTTVKDIEINEDCIQKIFNEIIGTKVEDGFQFRFSRLKPICLEHDYNNFRISLNAIYGKMEIPIKIDLTVGDVITPDAIEYAYPLMFEERLLKIKAYTLESIFAEKIEAVIQKRLFNTRIRDFYDIHVLYCLYKDTLKKDILKQAVEATMNQRKSNVEINEIRLIINEISESDILEQRWNKYKKSNSYASNISFKDIMITLHEIVKYLE